LIETATRIGAKGKGILAADESPGSIIKKFTPLGLENNEENRRRYRELLFTAPGIEQYISGIIFQEETARQATKDGVSFIEYAQAKGILAGIKVDKGLGELDNGKGENFTKGLEALPAMASEFYKLGCRFAKWRAVLKIGEGCPSDLAIQENAEGLARYAAICQENGLVPIVEPEIMPDGPHSVEESQRVTEKVLNAVFQALAKHNVLLEGCLLKPNMVSYGSEHPKRKENNIVEESIRTVRALSRTVPPALAGVTVFVW
jgi:fructose-bisphosphate aldolase class I